MILYPDNVPELPEVETITRGLDKRVAGDVIESVWIGSRKQPLKSPAGVIASTLEGKRIARVHRAGKHIVFDLEGEPAKPQTASSQKKRKGTQVTAQKPGGNLAHRVDRGQKRESISPATAQWIVHLGMTGRMVVCEPATEIAKHTHLIAKLASGRELRFVDPRMFGKLSVHLQSQPGGFDPGGVEPLEVSEEQFTALFRGRKTPIKSALLNQKLLRGVGNIYADESLFRAGIRPKRRAATITGKQLSELHHAVQEVLREAIKLGGSSISDYVDADGEEGFFQLQHRVYGREGEPCRVCGGAIRRVVLAGRSSHYCAECQK
ncbi:MAG: bifunctional DNA-formamidopyrimidine glycosylase/DNA-(apurinic or apyrimidinic site) lyase [Terriglobales bacterium]